jgi:hypothetical protein
MVRRKRRKIQTGSCRQPGAWVSVIRPHRQLSSHQKLFSPISCGRVEANMLTLLGLPLQGTGLWLHPPWVTLRAPPAWAESVPGESVRTATYPSSWKFPNQCSLSSYWQTSRPLFTKLQAESSRPLTFQEAFETVLIFQ